MQSLPEPFTFTIASAIVALPDLTLAERVVLTHLAKFPRCGNSKLARLTWLTHRGVESLIRRLCQRGQLLKVSVDGSRHLMVQGIAPIHTECGESHITKSHTPCGVVAGTASAALSTRTTAMAVREWTLAEFLSFETRVGDDLFRWGDWHYARDCYQRCIERVAKEPGLDEETRSGALAELKQKTDVLFALEHLVPPKGSASDRDRCKIGSVIFRAPAERLAEFRRRVEGGAVLLGPAVEVLSLAATGEAVSLSSANPAPDVPCDSGDGQSEQLGT